ncbi:MAG: dephospho-CoA kinase [Candidatus Omnitrophica bacterium]|nr:dephospho-CoA kinase [Candidatus Omnitrophota bacterium]
MPVIGVTGSFGSGKSLVAAMFKQRGASVFDADKAVHVLLAGKGPAVKSIVAVFGKEISGKKGIDRAALARVVFDNPKKMKRLTGILHPFVLREAEIFIRRHSMRRLVVLDVPLLIESGWVRMVDRVVVVKAGVTQQVERVFKRAGIRRQDALKRIKLQMPLRKKLKYADYVVDNRGSQADTDIQVQGIIDDLKMNDRKKKV